MKHVQADKIINIDTHFFDRKFLFHALQTDFFHPERQVFFMSDLLQKKKNEALLQNLNGKYAMYSEVYSPKDELEIFTELFEMALAKKQKIHIVGITLKEEIQLLEQYYEQAGYMRTDVNCFVPDFGEALVTVSVYIENLMWKGSDYKAQKQNIFFVPPVRESGQNKAMFKGVNRGSIAGICVRNWGPDEQQFLVSCITEEKILPRKLAEVLWYNQKKIGFQGDKKELVIAY